ncbi:SpvB/TcaC N-terminal domain-containing protein [Hamadaea tsunoensis]|uniref:SpvB/TcaC N-terminal domain-containing protein n=1 Tax=Hamadaea tsunoensis TaxID=53368 RepID=UPI0003F94DE8|nr:SpvB/TcaC N-terminal domain-containing protein [Hamadaea tsunoensis]
MGDQNAADLISLPPGGGAQQGIGETFQPDLHTGTVNFSVPLRTPAGRAGVQPQLTLAYSSGQGNGVFGVGWSLSVPGVRRRTTRGVPRYTDDDVFIMSGAEDLRPIAARPGDPAGVTRYRPRVESAFARIVRVRDGRGDFWEVHTREGLRSRYGTPRPDGAPADWTDPAVVTGPAGIFAWQLSETADTFGNRLVYEYAADPHGTAQRYLSAIRYVDLDDGRFLVHAGFAYADRPDPVTDRRPGFELRTTQRAVGMRTWTEAEKGVAVEGLRVGFGYAPGPGPSRLATIRTSGVDGDAVQDAPPLTFAYTPWNPDGRRLIAVGGPLPPTALGGELDLVDLFGDGLPSLVSLGEQARYWRNLGGGTFAAPRSLAAAPAGVRLGQPGVLFADVDGDGRTELVAGGAPAAYAWPLAPTADGQAGFGTPVRTTATLPLSDPLTRLTDLDGDGRMDLVRSDDRWYAADGDGRGGFTGLRPLRDAPPVSLADPRVRLADMTGDGLTDVVLLHDGHVVYWPSLGRGRFDTPVVMRDAPKFGEAGAYGTTGFDPDRLLVGDVTGDGTADVVYVGDGRITVWLNNCGLGFGEPWTVTGTPRVTNRTHLRLADLLGTGVCGLLWTADATQRAAYRFLDLTGGVKPHLLDGIDNHRGAVTALEYATSTEFARRDREAGRPWQTTLPTPVHVLARTTVADRFAGTTLTTEYAYHHGSWDGVEREFGGFARVEQRDTLSGGPAGSAPLEIRSWFHPGPVGPADTWRLPEFHGEYWPGDPLIAPAVTSTLPATATRREQRDAARALRGVLLRRETYALDGSPLQDRPYEVADTAYTLMVVDGSALAHPALARTAVWSRGVEPMVRLTASGLPDGYGRVGTELALAAPRVAGDPHLIQRTTTEYATRDDGTAYLITRPTRKLRDQLADPGGRSLAQLAAELMAAPLGDVRGHELTYYDGDDFTGLPFGEIGTHGLVTRAEQLVLTPEQLSAAGTPPYLTDSPVWTDEYPVAFRATVPALAGFTLHDEGYFATVLRAAYDGRGLLVTQRDALGADVHVTYDDFALLPAAVIDAENGVRSAVHDYRLLAVAEMTDVTGVRTRVGYTPLGQPAWTAQLGRDGVNEGDTVEQPGTVYVYDLVNLPLSVRTIRRVDHRWSIVDRQNAERAAAGKPPLSDAEIADLFPALDKERDRFGERFLEMAEYSDGFGRLLQARTQADEQVVVDLGLTADQKGKVYDPSFSVDSDRVAVSGARRYDDKGRVVQAWEPFHDTGLGYREPDPTGLASAVTTYDARGVAVAVTHADGSVELHVPGVPDKLGDPTVYRPTPWETYRYDRDDNARRTHKDASAGWSQQWDTPQSTTVDALGRVVRTVEHLPDTEPAVTVTERNIEGAVVAVTDALGRVAATTVHDLAGHAVRAWTIDGGAVRTWFDALGGPVETRDDRDMVTLSAYDVRHRPVSRWGGSVARGVTLRGTVSYGQPGTLAAGHAVVTHDEAGRLTADAYDLGGNLLRRTRRVLRTDLLLGALPSGPDAWEDTAYPVDWAVDDDTVLDPTDYAIDADFDALGRCRTTTTPENADGGRTVLSYAYTRAGRISAIAADGKEVLSGVCYNARGQRVHARLGNGLATRYIYDPATFRLARLFTDRAGEVVQDYAYGYDLVGNLLTLADRSPGSGMPIAPGQPLGPDALDRAFGYDALYRLTAATGRKTAPPPDEKEPWRDQPAPTDVTIASAYAERYDYDLVGNLLTLTHRAATGYTRDHALAAGSNRLAALSYDDAGNVVAEGGVRRWEWDHARRCATFRVQTGTAEPSIYAQYRYDAAGSRVTKLVRRGARTDVWVYVDGFERLIRGAQDPATATVHDELPVSDGVNKVLVLRRGAKLPGDPYPQTLYHLGDHLASSTAVADEDGRVLNREEYTPFGETSFGGYATKRYRFTAKERDEESGLAYHGLRYYAPWRCRWTAPDPQFPTGSLTWYRYAGNNPLNVIDPTGAADEPSGVNLPKDATQEVNTPSGQAFRSNPFSWESFKTMLMGGGLWAGTPQKHDGTELTGPEQRSMMVRNISLVSAYARGLGFHTSHYLLGEKVPEGSVRSEMLGNVLAFAGPLLNGVSEFRQMSQAGSEFRAWNAAHTEYQAIFRNATTDASGAAVSAAEMGGLTNTIEMMAWRNWKLSPVQFKYSGNKGLDLHFLGVGENQGLRAIGEAKGAGGLGALAVPETTAILGGYRQGGEAYIGMSLATYVERGGAEATEANQVMSMLRSGNVRSFLGTSNGRLYELQFFGNVDFNKTRNAARLLTPR